MGLKTVMWKQLIRGFEGNARFLPPATPEQLHQVEEAIQVELPEELKSLLAETNGVSGEYGVTLLWSTDQIIHNTAAYRMDYGQSRLKTFDTFVFFADAGNGDLFGYSIVSGRIPTTEIHAWNHEDDTNKIIAPSLRDYLQGWLQGTITI